MNGRIVLALLSLLLGAWSPSPPSGVNPLYTRAFQFDGDCNNGDMVFNWRISTGPPAQPSWHIAPFLPGEVTIRGVELTMMSPIPAGAQWWMVGNDTAEGDAMLFMGGDESHRMQWFPIGTGWQLPGTGQAGPADYIDLHGFCASGHATIMLTFYYTL